MTTIENALKAAALVAPLERLVRPHVVPITLKQAREFVAAHHRHNKPPVGWKFGLGLQLGEALIGVATAGRPVARDFDDGQDDALCWECGQIHDVCECHVGEECGRWRNGVLSGSCTKAGSEECDFECPYGR